jgi:sugar phosphate isomerase/epimerase
MAPAPLPLDRLCIHQVTLMQCDFRQSMEVLARHGVTKTAIWREKLDEIGTVEAARILRDLGIEAVSLCAGGLLSASDPAARQRALDANRRWIDQAAAIDASSIVTITGGLEDNQNDLRAARDHATCGLAELLPHARAAGVRIALEPLHPMVCGSRSVISTVREANEMLCELKAPDVMGIAVDSYALWWDHNLQADLDAAASNILNFHVSDWLAETRDVRLDRGMPGDGQIDNRKIRGWIEAGGFGGPVEVEIFSSRDWWKRDPDEVVRTIVKRAGSAL